MDLQLFLNVVWRSKWLVAFGTLIAITLAVLTYGRSTEVWQGQSQLLITQASFPYGRAVQQYAIGSAKANIPAVPIGEASYMSALAPVYSALANGDAVQGQLRQQLHVTDSVKAENVINSTIGTNLPLVNLTATAPTRDRAATLVERAALILRTYVNQQQTAAQISPSQRVQLLILQSGANAQLVKGHKLSVAILVFLAVLTGVLTLVFVRENLRASAATEAIEASQGTGAVAPAYTRSENPIVKDETTNGDRPTGTPLAGASEHVAPPPRPASGLGPAHSAELSAGRAEEVPYWVVGEPEASP